MNRHGKWILIATTSAVLALNSGCIFFHGYTRGRPIDDAAFSELIVAQDEEEDVEEKLGLPDAIIPLKVGTIFRYDYTKTNTFLLLIIGHTSRQDDKVYMIFNDEGVLADKKAQSLTKDLGWRLWPFGR
ncbi:MAG: hypothetical protein HQ592_14220 [Planctomycetes bacterium]|nr:hypothetical protein [Planctomycetota bacterium]